MSKHEKHKKAFEYAKTVYENKPITIYFSRIPPICRRGCYSGYHPTVTVHVDADGKIWKQHVAGFHCLPTDTKQTYIGNEVENLADAAMELLAWKREYEPFSGYPECGVRLIIAKDEFGDEYLDQQFVFLTD